MGLQGEKETTKNRDPNAASLSVLLDIWQHEQSKTRLLQTEFSFSANFVVSNRSYSALAQSVEASSSKLALFALSKK